jgi:hypothetical protein
MEPRFVTRDDQTIAGSGNHNVHFSNEIAVRFLERYLPKNTCFHDMNRAVPLSIGIKLITPGVNGPNPWISISKFGGGIVMKGCRR